MKFVYNILKILLLSSIVSVAQAHSDLARSQPSANELLESSPEELVLTFSGRSRLVGLALIDEQGEPLDIGFKPSITERVTFKVPLVDALLPGVYSVNWAILGEDGHRITGSILFGVDDSQ